MNERNRATRAALKRMSPTEADSYIKSFNLPKTHERLLYILYVMKIKDVMIATGELEREKIFISYFKAVRIHKEALSWITSDIKKRG